MNDGTTYLGLEMTEIFLFDSSLDNHKEIYNGCDKSSLNDLTHIFLFIIMKLCLQTPFLP